MIGMGGSWANHSFIPPFVLVPWHLLNRGGIYVNLVNLTDEIVSNALFTLITRGCWFNFMKSLLDTLSCTFPTLSQGLAKKNFAKMCVLLEGTLTTAP